MADNITPDEYRAEISMLNHEIYELQKQLHDKEEEQQRGSIPDKYNPFDNPTEYPDYNGDYSEIVPQIELPGCKLPVEPNRSERKKLRHFYNIGGTSLLCHYAFISALATALLGVIMLVLQFKNPDVSYNSLYEYASDTSIIIALNTVLYLIANVLFSFIGLKWANIPASSLIKTRDFSFGKAFQYCFSAIFIQYAAAVVMSVVSDIFSRYGYDTDTTQISDMADSGIAFIITILYSCIIAPITEELLFRGMLLKTFSKANQRFAAVATAVFFGLTHGNLPQFMLAFLLGLFLAHITFKHNSIIPAIITHMFVNTTATVINELSETYTSNMAAIILNLIYMAMAFLGFIMFIEFSLKNKMPSTTPQQSRRGFAIAATSIPTILVFLVMTGSMLLTVLSSKITV